MTDQEGAAMTPDIITEARELLDAATPGPWYCFTDDSAGKDSLHLMSEYDDGSWVEGKQGPFPLDPFTYDPTPMERATAHFIAAAPRLVTELVAEVERLRHELDQRTNPELAARLVKHADTAMRDSTTVHGYYVSLSDDLLDAARLLGGDQ